MQANAIIKIVPFKTKDMAFMKDTMIRKRGRRGSPESWSVDGHVGQRLRIRRTLLGMSQEKLGEAIGLTFQQVQKYERGSNRISAGTLYRLGQVLDVPVSFFFDGFEDDTKAQGGFRENQSSYTSGDGISRRDARLLRLWRAAPPNIADEILSLLSSLSPQVAEAVAEEIQPASSPDLQTMCAGKDDSSVAEALSTRQRRRHGAVWDPADIYASAKSGKK